MNKYLEKIAEQSNREAEAAKVAGKAVLSDKVGDVAGGLAGAGLAGLLRKDKKTGAMLGAIGLGSGLTYASIRRDYLNKKAGIAEAVSKIFSPPVQRPITSETATRTIGIRG